LRAQPEPALLEPERRILMPNQPVYEALEKFREKYISEFRYEARPETIVMTAETYDIAKEVLAGEID
jgi:hypothetical protein